MIPIIQIGPFAVQTPRLILLLSVWLGLSLAEKAAPRRNIDSDTIYNLAFAVIIAALISGRISYIMQHAEAFTANPLDAFSLDSNLFDPLGGIALASITVLIYGLRFKLEWRNMLDAFTPALAVIMIGIALANFASGEAFGTETSLPWAINLWGAARHPVQIYELISALIILIGLALLDKQNTKPGMTFFQWMALSAGARLIFEAFRETSMMVFEQFRLEQIIAWIVLAIALLLLNRR